MNRSLFLVLCSVLFLSGCVSVESLGEVSLGSKEASSQATEARRTSLDKPKVSSAAPKAIPSAGLTKIDRVQLGMSSGEVAALMRNEITVGYEQSEYLKGAYKPITLQNPYRTEVFKDNSRTYIIEYYFTHIKKEDGVVADDELTPLVFENKILLGMGWDFLTLVKGSPAY